MRVSRLSLGATDDREREGIELRGTVVIHGMGRALQTRGISYGSCFSQGEINVVVGDGAGFFRELFSLAEVLCQIAGVPL